ncbi:EamA-like transporter family [Seminavis robusta]|uniref:EamA-like transporter family n=1 Tax=Seminavis robusta TaxID=568900 RepID=A0A9N8EN03_9STRA|nr:EamA-like transporter family [Seminavis robusta]|eukprot:Sro1443_g273130.1 EamA-like transporter family (500) ;mRNA; f:4511-6010
MRSFSNLLLLVLVSVQAPVIAGFSVATGAGHHCYFPYSPSNVARVDEFPKPTRQSTFQAKRRRQITSIVAKVTLDHQEQQLHQGHPENNVTETEFSDTSSSLALCNDVDAITKRNRNDEDMASITTDATLASLTIDNTDPSMLSGFLGMTPNAILALNMVAIIWGSQHAVVKMVVDDAQAGPFTLLRFAIGAIIATVPMLWINTSQEEHPDHQQGKNAINFDNNLQLQDSAHTNGTVTVLRWGAEMGFWMFLGFAFQAIGLATTTAQRSGFLLYLNVKFVPFFAFLLFGRQISLPTWISALTAFCGTALLAYDGTSWSLNQGDLWSMAAAAASAMYILRLDTAANAVGDNNSVALNAACLWMVTLLSAIWSFAVTGDDNTVQLVPQLMHIIKSHPWELFYLSAVTTALANYIQTLSQKEVSAERASVIYAMDPVYGAAFSNVLLGESLSSLGLVGAGLITAAAATNALMDLGEEQKPSSKDDAAKLTRQADRDKLDKLQ